MSQEEQINALFAKAETDPTAVSPISKYVTVGRRWDYKHSDVMDKVVILHRVTPIDTQYGEAYLGDCDVEGQQVTVLFGSDVLKRQIEDLKEHLPVVCSVHKPGKAYVFRDCTPEELEEYKNLYLTSEEED